MVESRQKPQLVWVQSGCQVPPLCSPAAHGQDLWTWAGATCSGLTTLLTACASSVCLCFCPRFWRFLLDRSSSLTPSLLCWSPRILPQTFPTSSSAAVPSSCLVRSCAQLTRLSSNQEPPSCLTACPTFICRWLLPCTIGSSLSGSSASVSVPLETATYKGPSRGSHFVMKLPRKPSWVPCALHPSPLVSWSPSRLFNSKTILNQTLAVWPSFIYFSQQNGFIRNQQSIAIWGLQPRWTMLSLSTARERGRFYGAEEEAGRVILMVNQEFMAFHWLSMT